MTDITEIPAKDGKLYVSAVFDCYDLMPNGLAMADHMRAELCCETLKHANLRFPEICGAIVHSDRGSQYTSAAYRAVIQKYGIVQSMNRAGGRCHDNARCESIWARMKEELFYHRGRKAEHYNNGRTEIHGLAVFHELLEQPQDLLVHWRASSCCKAAKILRSGCRRTFRFIILVGNVPSVIDNFILMNFQPSESIKNVTMIQKYMTKMIDTAMRNCYNRHNKQNGTFHRRECI